MGDEEIMELLREKQMLPKPIVGLRSWDEGMQDDKESWALKDYLPGSSQ